MAFAIRTLHQIRRNLTRRRLLSFPHALVLIWILVLLRGERWAFQSSVSECAWNNWEKWPKDANPHHLALIADPQLIDPHSYPSRPWPLSALTALITDKYMQRSYVALQRQLRPDSVFFLGDLFDGGREWKTRQGTRFVDPKWGTGRSGEEKKWVSTWHRRYGQDFWLREYKRFGRIFVDNWSLGGNTPGPWQRGRKLVASLPGNHDIGFGAQVQLPVRDRFTAFFGDGNRVDIVGNHSVVTVDAVSLGADTSTYKNSHDLRPIYGPVNEFLDKVQAIKRRAAQTELSVWHDTVQHPVERFPHRVEGITMTTNKAETTHGQGPDLPTILLTHVPLYRDPGTPCGPHREHWPPSKPPKGQSGIVHPDSRNAITVAAGYQYQNVLSEEDSVKMIRKVGNVVHVFSGDDHDYCELKHSAAKYGVREITVKSFSMAMGVPTPGFLMVSLWNPVDANGRSLAPETGPTLQTHLCLLPKQLNTYIRYAALIIVSLAVLAVRALLVPVLHLSPFALKPEPASTQILPLSETRLAGWISGGEKAKRDPPDYGRMHSSPAAASSGTARWSAKKSGRRDRGGPRIKLDDDFYEGAKAWKRGRGLGIGSFGQWLQEMWTTTWRVAWMTILFWVYLARRG
ncbi:hypothetical protein CDD82_2970 [Ophiocordyceps australis]|uniref:Calcineurin-like phosphoesterase domain-containing protein n=1 Tax=Ophiocordyceps australis TaxID=1399860 RepID=A0A2C5XSA6_9HYPO|nr:hypothetical protein CDD82_2970 [Ophiocordyceps australis]